MQRWKKEWKNSGKCQHGSWRKSETKERSSMKQGKKAKQCISRHRRTSVIWRIPSWNHNFKNTKAELHSEVSKRWFRILCSIHRARFICVTNDGNKSDGCHGKITRMRRTSSSCRISLHPGQNGRWPLNVQTFGFVYHDINGLNHDPVWKIQSFLMDEICTVILWQDYDGKGISRKFCWSFHGGSACL